MSGIKKGETFDCYGKPGFVPLEHPIELHLSCRSMRGWPKILLEVWGIDKHQRNKIEGYGTAFIPTTPGLHNIEVVCWRPKETFWDSICGTQPELQYPDLLISSQQRNNMKGVSAGRVRV